MSNEEIMKVIQNFIDRYEKDMRGDMNCGNGEKGLVGELRAIKDHLKEYPTIAYEFKKSPFKVIGIFVGMFALLYFVMEAGLISTGLFATFLKLFGV